MITLQATHSSGMRRHHRHLFVLLLQALAVLTALSIVGQAQAHQLAPNGAWTYRYYTRANDSSAYINCNSGSLPGAVDPLNIIGYRYGEGVRMHRHLTQDQDSNYGHTLVGSDQVTCVTTDGQGYGTNVMFDQAANASVWNRGHFRSFTAGHWHDDIEFKWSVFDFHHEGACCVHDPNDHWETWEEDIAWRMYPEHNIYWEEYARVGPGNWRGPYYDSGAVTRIGGLHGGGY
jgi:hypothetical protein